MAESTTLLPPIGTIDARLTENQRERRLLLALRRLAFRHGGEGDRRRDAEKQRPAQARAT